MQIPTTIWDRVVSARTNPEAMSALLEQYYPAIRAYMAVRLPKHLDPDDGAQQFVQSKILEGALLEKADRSIGRFRDYLKRSLRNFACDIIQNNKSVDRFPTDFDPPDDVTFIHAEDTLDRVYAQAVLTEAVECVREHCLSNGYQHDWRVLEAQVLTPASKGCRPVSAEELVRELGVETKQKIYTMKETALRMVRSALCEVVRTKGIDEKDIEREIQDVLACLAPRH